MEEKQLTIIIPTYNRRDRLIRQLDSLYAQSTVAQCHMVILDNCSDYDIQDALTSHGFTSQFLSLIELIRHPLNTRMGYNLAGTLLCAKTQWLWLVSDDDISTPDSIDTVLSYARTYPEASLVKFQFTFHRTFDDIIVKSVDDLEREYKDSLFTPGDLFYLGNNLINTLKLKDYLGDAFEHSSHLIPFVLPALHQLVDGKANIIFSDKHVQTYCPNNSGDTWMAVPTILKFAELFDVSWNKARDTKRVFRIICNHFNVPEVVRMLLDEKDRKYRRYAYYRLKKTIFNRPQSFKEHMFWVAYLAEDYLHIPTLSKILPWLKHH